jgi:archaellin
MSVRYLIVALVFAILFMTGGCANEEKEIPAPKIYLTTSNGVIEMEITDTLVIDPQIIYDYNSQYSWIENGNVISNEKKLIIRPTKHEIRDLSFEVKNSKGADKVDLQVQVIIISDFESFNLNSNSVIYNSGENLAFSEGIISYPNQADLEKRNWNGFAISNRTQVSTSDSTSIFRVNTATGGGKSKTFGIFHHKHGIDNRITFSDGKIHDLKSIDICNNLFTAQAVKYGFQSASIAKFEKGDWLSVQITAYSKDGAITGIKEEILADYRFENPAKYTILSSWTTVDLTGINDVAAVDLIVRSSRGDIPSYVCIDNLKLYN